MERNIEKYKEGISKNIEEISEILSVLEMNTSELLPMYEKTLSASSQNITNKWLSGRKYARTYFSQKAFSEFYPEEHTELSLSIDVMVNILDDLFDEEFNQEEKALYILEFLRVFSLSNYSFPNRKIQAAIGRYFNKLITLALAENIYKNLIKQESDHEKIVKYSAELLLCRGMDIDIFNEIALANYDKNVDQIKEIGRIFRAINILKKDIKDIDYDKENNMESIITNILDRDNIDFSKYITDLILYLSEKAYDIAKASNHHDDIIKTGIDGFMKMIKEMTEEIKEEMKTIKS